ncbi:MAG TPA: DUF47 family protein [Candidatus Dormibacteraeota bacterium]|nr:DUF47 family protein [Candidatus Dormibacteraeota bacterium]
MRFSLIPREQRFYELFTQQAQLVRRTLAELSASLGDGTSHHDRLRYLEHECDDVTHKIYNLANRTFAPPIDAADILALAHSMDEIVDLAEEIADKIDLYGVTGIKEPAKEMALCLAQAGDCLADAVGRLIDFEDVGSRLEEIHRLENEGDRLTRQALQSLLGANHQTPAEIIKWKDLYSLLESTLDECESAAEIIETMAIKHG